MNKLSAYYMCTTAKLKYGPVQFSPPPLGLLTTVDVKSACTTKVFSRDYHVAFGKSPLVIFTFRLVAPSGCISAPA